VKFIDPKEKAFTLEVPKGWKVVEGGMFRASAIEPRTMVAVASPDGIEVVVGDKNLPTFALPGFSPMFPEGSWYSPGYGVKMLVKRYMSGGDFAEAYATAAMEGETTDLKFVKKRDLANEVAKINRIYQEFNSPLINTTMSLGDVAFTCHRNGVQTRGYCIAMTQLTRSQGMGNWIVKLLAGYSAPAAKDVQARAAMERMVKSFRFNDAWLRMQKGIAANVSQIVARTNDEISGIINDSYWRRQVVQEDVARRRSNAMLRQTDLVDPDTGDTYKVRAGSNYYWGRPGDDTVVGTQTADRPDIDFHQMTEW